jgi:spore germination protein GerM
MGVLLVAFVICAAVLGALILQKYEERNIKPAVPQASETGMKQITLFFATADGNGLVREGREIDPCASETDCVDAVLEELSNGPLGDLEPTLPLASLRAAGFEPGAVVVDLSHELVEGIPSGSHAEMMAIYSIVDTIAINFPDFQSVRFLVDGKRSETLKGHLDLREPLTPDFSMEMR